MREYLDKAGLQEYTEKLVAKLRTIFPGTPLSAGTVAEMTDTSRIYVYTGTETGYTAGNWYYWSGSAWVSGGVYNAEAINTDTTLTVPGMAADGKATGDAIDVVQTAANRTQDELNNLVTYRELFDGNLITKRKATNQTTLVNDSKARGYIFPTVVGCKYRISHTCNKNSGRLLVYYSSNGTNFYEDTDASIPNENISAYNETTFTASYPYAFVLIFYGSETETRTFNLKILETYVNTFDEFKIGNVEVPTEENLTGVTAKYVSESMTAPANLSVGAFVLAAKKLYRVTENIASGGTITPGTNVTETTIGEQLSALWAAVNL